MRLFVGFDDTDSIDCGRGTGKLARWFAEKVCGECACHGVVRQQLLYRSDIPMTSHNSSLTVILEVESREWAKKLEIIAREHIMEHFVEGSDPGLCIALADDPNLPAMAEFGLRATYEKVTMEEAYDTCGTAHLSGHGGTNMGVIGAAAGVGLTWRGESGRFVEFRTIRTIAEETAVSELSELGIMVISVNRHAEIPRPGDIVVNHGSLRPRLLGGRPVVPVISTGPGRWSTINEKADY